MTFSALSFKQSLVHTLGKIYPMAKRWLYKFHGGVFPAYHKDLASRHGLKDSFIPKELVLPLQQHLGITTEPLVKVGDCVQKNQRLADTEKGLSAPIHAPTSGVITAIEERPLPHASGLTGLCIVMRTDGKHTTQENVLQTDGVWPDSPDALKDIVHRAGIVGMGGAGFPTFAKIPKQKGQIKTLLVNGAECEPFITCDDVLMQQRPDDIVKGAEIVAKALGIDTILCGIEDNKPKAIQSMQAASARHTDLVEIRPVATVYPMGGQDQLTKELVNVEVPADKHAVDVGLLMMNVATLAAIYEAVTHGTPLTSRLVTVSGLGLEAPFNMDVLLGTPFDSLIALASPNPPLNYPLIKGGPMMGVKMATNQVPVVKTTNCILANPPEQKDNAMPCIRCGECMDACPINLLPQQMYWHSRSHEFDKVEALKVFDCIECGCCSFVCPSQIPLVQYYRFAKSEIKLNRKEQAATELAKQRNEFKLARIEREKQEREARMKAKKDAVKKKAAASKAASDDAPKKPKATGAAAAAAARAAAARKKASTATPGETAENAAPKLSARDKAIAAAKKRTAAAKNQDDTTTAENSETAKPLSARDKAIAAAKKRAAAKQSQSSETESSTKPEMSAKEKAIAAAKKRATAKTSEPTQDATEVKTPADDKEAKRKAAMAAARARAAAKKVGKPVGAIETESNQVMEDADATETAAPTEDKEAKRKAAMAAAKARAAAKKAGKPVGAIETESNQVMEEADATETAAPAEDKEAKRKAAMAAARARAAAKKAQQNKKAEETVESSTAQNELANQSEETSPAEDKESRRKAAIEAARQRAAARKKANQTQDKTE